MSVVSQIWTSVKTGIVLLLAVRNAEKLSSGGDFVVTFAVLFTLVLVVALLENNFLLSVPDRFSQFDMLRDIALSLAGYFVLWSTYVIAAEISSWFQNNYMNGPYVLELVLVVVMVIAVFVIVGGLFAHDAKPRARDIEHLLLISNAAA
jgi:hypothetical protein